ncbi:hypothetical protein PISMIDRAFT_56653, partial [Pisolithus microcarpus 441]
YYWLADSTTTSHICAQREVFTDTVTVRSKLSDRTITVHLHDVLHMPTLPNNLFSIGCLDSQGGRSTCSKGCIKLYDASGNMLAIGKRESNLYKLQFETTMYEHNEANQAVEKHSWKTWH